MNGIPIARVGVLGATGYAGRELVGLLAEHSRCELTFATSRSEVGQSMRTLARRAPEMSLIETEAAPLEDCDVVFSCLPHGESAAWAERARSAGARVIDLSADLRVPGADTPKWAAGAVYGLPELNRARLKGAKLVANPGCYPTAAILALAPLLRRGLVSGPVMIDAASGTTGAGRSPKRNLLFAEVAEDYRAYATGNSHRHLREMVHQATLLAEGAPTELVFTPHLLPVRRGILETLYVPVRDEAAMRRGIDFWLEDYEDEIFVDVLDEGMPGLTDVVGTNRVAIGVTPIQGVAAPHLQIVAAMDNLIKGASGQAVQNLNLMCGWCELEGLPC